MRVLLLIFFLFRLLSSVIGNIPDTINCSPNNTEVYVEEINLEVSPFPIVLHGDNETVSIQFSFDVIKSIPIGSTVQVRLVEQGAIPTPLPCFPVIIDYEIYAYLKLINCEKI